MKKLNKIDDYLDKVKIKKAYLGGFDEVDVYRVINSVCTMYDEMIEENQKQLREQKIKNGQLQDSEASVKARIRALVEKTKRLEKENETYRKENERLTAIVSPCMTIKEELCQQAEKEAEKIRRQAEKDVEKLRKLAEREAEKVRKSAEQEAEALYKDGENERDELLIQVGELKQAKENILQSFNIIQRFCAHTQDEIYLIWEQEKDKNADETRQVENLKDSTDIFGKHLQEKIEEQFEKAKESVVGPV